MSNEQPPQGLKVLAQWLKEGVAEEIKSLEKDGGTQKYEVQAGELVQESGKGKAIYHFVVAGGVRVPEDSSGQLQIGKETYLADVISQQGNRIDVQVESATALPKRITQAVLLIDDTALLRKLEDALAKAMEGSLSLSDLSNKVFHPEDTVIGAIGIDSNLTVPPDKAPLIAKAFGSDATFVWGPPGTGKTFSIAHLVAAATSLDERLLVTSHTRAAVDQALYETVTGPLKDHQDMREGKVLRIGITTDKKVPLEVQLDKVVEARAKEINDQVLAQEAELEGLREQHAAIQDKLSEWDNLAQYERQLQQLADVYEKARDEYQVDQTAIRSVEGGVEERNRTLERAQRAWFGRSAKVARAQQVIEEAKVALQATRQKQRSLNEQMEASVETGKKISAKVAKQKAYCEGLPKKEDLTAQLPPLEADIEKIRQVITALQDQITKLQEKLIAEAKVVFCTLTKNYVGAELENQSFDAVIVDEISMALPPLIFLAAGRARKRAILVGDFLQLPPIVRSDNEISDARLKQDIFHLAGVADGLKPADNSRVLYKLDGQHRMVPAIADVARHLVYNQAGGLSDHPTVSKRQPPVWLSFLPGGPLLVVDTADLRCWCGREPGSLSRFNIYSAHLAVEIAAMAAAQIQEPDHHESTPIGIVTPYAAQRRLLTKLVDGLGLSEWVTAGTVHTFQGGQADLIIFDSVLDEPYWSSRLTNPNNMDDVKRDLNVAVTRTKDKFVFLGSSEWLNGHAKQASALGALWSYIVDHADLVPVTDLVEDRFTQHISQTALSADNTWRVPLDKTGKPTQEILDEKSFYDRFEQDLDNAQESIVGLVPYFGQYRWPRVQPLLAGALRRNVQITLITPPAGEAEDPDYVQKAIQNMRELGAVVVISEGLHGKDIVIDEKIHYTGSLNWASHRGRSEVMHRVQSKAVASQVLKFLQAKHIREAAVSNDGVPRVCPECGGPIRIINQRRLTYWDFQPLKIGCANHKETGCKYLRNIDERPPLKEPLRCHIDGRTKYRRSRRGKGEVWQCPKHPRQCPTEKVVPGDPSRF